MRGEVFQDQQTEAAVRQSGAAEVDVSVLFESTRSASSVEAGVFTPDTRANRLAAVGMQSGDEWFETDTGWLYYYTGLAWAYKTGVNTGTDAARGAITPAANDNGALFFATDTLALWEVSAAAWAKRLEVVGTANQITASIAGGVLTLSTPNLTVATKTVNYTLTDADDVVLVDASGGAVAITLHAVATARRKLYHFKKVDASANAMTLDPNGAETVDGAATLATTTQWTAFSLLPTSGGWMIL